MSIETKNQTPDRYTERLNQIEQLVNENNEQLEDEFISSEMERLDSESEKKELSIMWNNFYEGYLNSKSEVKRTIMLMDSWWMTLSFTKNYLKPLELFNKLLDGETCLFGH